jgi:hypothetical protein
MTEATNSPNAPTGEPADETPHRDSAPAIADFHGEEDPEAELLLQALLTAVTR